MLIFKVISMSHRYQYVLVIASFRWQNFATSHLFQCFFFSIVFHLHSILVAVAVFLFRLQFHRTRQQKLFSIFMQSASMVRLIGFWIFSKPKLLASNERCDAMDCAWLHEREKEKESYWAVKRRLCHIQKFNFHTWNKEWNRFLFSIAWFSGECLL